MDARSLAPNLPESPTAPPPRHISARDVRDLALAVVEGAVAAEALAKELKRSPDRSRHFQDIAERLRAVVARTSIRSALAEDTPSASVLVSPSATPSMTPRTPPLSIVSTTPLPAPTPLSSPVVSLAPVAPAVNGANVTIPRSAEETRLSGERVVPPLTSAELVSIVTRAVHGDEIATRLARLEHAVSAVGSSVNETTAQVASVAHQTMVSANSGERIAVSTPAEAIALAARLTERVQSGQSVTVRIEPVSSSVRRG